MIRLDCEQGSHEWLVARIGIPTGSQCDRLMPPRTRKPTERTTQKIRKYRNELLAELFFGEPFDTGSSQFMQRGSDLENEAIRQFEFEHGCTVDRVGFCLRDDRRFGVSPDGLIRDDEGLEIKCAGAVEHIGALLDPDDDKHIHQVQAALYVTGRKRWWYRHYHPTLPPVWALIERDDEFIGELEESLDDFLDQLDTAKARLIEMGCKPVAPRDPEAFCKGLRPDTEPGAGRWCYKREGLTRVEDGTWRCAEHAMPKPDIMDHLVAIHGAS